MEKVKLCAAFNEWMRRYIAEPSRFEREWELIVQFQKEEAVNKEPSYGTIAVAYLEQLMAEQ